MLLAEQYQNAKRENKDQAKENQKIHARNLFRSIVFSNASMNMSTASIISVAARI